MLKVKERMRDATELFRSLSDKLAFDLRVAIPGIIQSFDSKRQTVTVKLALRERVVLDGTPEWTEIPELLDVPVFINSGGGYCLTMPIAPGDDCLVVFGDMCIDGWWQSGGVQNQVERRRHDLSDGFAIVGFRSQPNAVSNYSASAAQLRNKSGSAYIEIKGDEINIVASGKVKVNGKTIYLN